MPRVKGGYVTRRRRKAVLKLAKGYYGSKHTLYKTAHEQVMRSLAYAYRDRKVKKREFRKLWIQRINAAAKLNGLKYSTFICGLTRAGVEVNRKMLAELAVNDAQAFAQFCEVAKNGLTMPSVKVQVKGLVFQTESKAVKAEKRAQLAAQQPVVEEVVEEVVVDYNKMTVAELKAIAKERGIAGISAMKKADLVAALSE